MYLSFHLYLMLNTKAFVSFHEARAFYYGLGLPNLITTRGLLLLT